MNNDFKHSDERLQQKMEQFRMPAPEGAWSGIEQGLAQDNGRGRRFLFLLLLLLIIGGASVGGFLFLFGNDSGETKLSPNTSRTASDGDINKDITLSNSFSNNTNDNALISDDSDSSESENRSFNNDQVMNSTNYSKRDGSTRITEKNKIDPESNEKLRGRPPMANPNETATNNEARLGAELPKTAVLGVEKKLESQSEQQNTSQKSNDLQWKPSFLEAKSLAYLTNRNQVLADIENFGYNKTRGVKPAWSVEAGADISQFNYSAPGSDASQQMFFEDSYTQSRAFGGFLRANIRPFSKWSFHTGLEFTQEDAYQEYTATTTITTTQYDSIGAVFDSVWQTWIPIYDTVEVTSEIQQQYRAENSVSQIRIPFGVMYHIPIGLRSELGINLSGLVGIRVRNSGSLLINEQGETVSANDAFARFSLGARTSLRYTYILNERYAVYAEPYFSFGLNNQSGDSVPFEMRFNNSGLRVGIRWSF